MFQHSTTQYNNTTNSSLLNGLKVKSVPFCGITLKKVKINWQLSVSWLKALVCLWCTLIMLFSHTIFRRLLQIQVFDKLPVINGDGNGGSHVKKLIFPQHSTQLCIGRSVPKRAVNAQKKIKGYGWPERRCHHYCCIRWNCVPSDPVIGNLPKHPGHSYKSLYLT